MKRKITIRISSLLIAVLLICTVVPVGVSAKSSEKLDYVGMISRRDKYDKYVKDDTTRELWYHHVTLRVYGTIDTMAPFATCLDSDIRDQYFRSGSTYASWATWKDEQTKQAFYTYVSEQSKTFPGLPNSWYLVRYASITREQLEESVKKYMANENLPFESCMVDAMYCDDIRTIIETYMSPDFVMNMDWFNAKYGSGASSDDQLSMGMWAINIMQTPIETLEQWGYSDEYWLDYYSFISYLAEISDNSPENSLDSIAWNSGYCVSNTPEERAELDRRVELYANRVANAETGDDSAVRAVFLATAAVVCAIIPATVAVKRRRRED